MNSCIVLLLLCGAVAFGEATSSFEGVVVDAVTGEPVRKVSLQLSWENGTRFSNVSVTSGADGHFTASGLGPGEYAVHAERQGYLECDCLSGVKIGTGQKITGVQIKLTKYGAISGRVLDTDGDAWPKGSVAVYRWGWKHGKRRLERQDLTEVDDRGAFRIGKLEPGKYFVAAEPGGYLTYQTSFYPGTLDPSAAVPVEVASGQEVIGIDIQMRTAATYCVRGRIYGLDPLEFSSSGGGRLSVEIHWSSGLFDEWRAGSLERKPEDRFQFCNIPSGSYAIRVRSISGGYLSSVFTALGETLVEVDGHDVNDVGVTIAPPRPVKASVQIEGVDHPDLSSITLHLFSEDGGFTAATADDGFTFRSVAVAVYQIRLEGAANAKYFVKSVRAGSLEFPDAVLDLRRTGDSPILVTLSDKGASIKCKIKTDSPDPAHTKVTLIPDLPDADRREREASEATVDQSGTFALDNIPPGEYRLFAWQNLPEDAWKDPDFWNAMREKGVSVKLAESEKEEIELPLIPAQDTVALLSRLGIQ